MSPLWVHHNLAFCLLSCRNNAREKWSSCIRCPACCCRLRWEISIRIYETTECERREETYCRPVCILHPRPVDPCIRLDSIPIRRQSLVGAYSGIYYLTCIDPHERNRGRRRCWIMWKRKEHYQIVLDCK